MQLEEEGKEQRRNSDQMGERGASAPIMTESYRVIKLLFHILLMPLPTAEQQSNKHTLCFQPFLCPFYALARSRVGGYYPVGRQPNNCLMQPSPQQNPWKWFKNMGSLGFPVILRLCFMWGHVPVPCTAHAAGDLPPLSRWPVLPELWDQVRAEPWWILMCVLEGMKLHPLVNSAYLGWRTFKSTKLPHGATQLSTGKPLTLISIHAKYERLITYWDQIFITSILSSVEV